MGLRTISRATVGQEMVTGSSGGRGQRERGGERASERAVLHARAAVHARCMSSGAGSRAVVHAGEVVQGPGSCADGRAAGPVGTVASGGFVRHSVRGRWGAGRWSEWHGGGGVSNGPEENQARKRRLSLLELAYYLYIMNGRQKVSKDQLHTNHH